MNVILVLVVALLVVERHVEAEFMYNRILPKEDELESFGLKCIPGRTTIRIEEERPPISESEGEDDDDEMDFRRTHMNYEPSNEKCQICVCSVEGKDEYCSRRPAKNVNECIRMSMIKSEFERNVPYSHERSLAYRIRRDYIWHDDEIPYEAKANCRRGRSYYSNSINANDTDIDVASDVDSLLDYSNKDVCFYCVCSLDGRGAGCIPRDPVFCEYFRIIRFPNAARDRYRHLFQQDRPAYFRQLSYRLRRTMDEGLYEFMDNGGDALCCGHPDGHRRNLHDRVRNKIRLMRRKVPKENIMSGSPTVGSGLDDSSCLPYVSEYTDCSDVNACNKCTRCTCDEDGKWLCKEVVECLQDDKNNIVDNEVLDNALHSFYTGVEKKKKGAGSLVPPPPSPDEDLLLVPAKFDFDEELKILLSRHKRSAADGKNATVTFYDTIDEINEDTLKNLNKSGTLEARKISTKGKAKLSERVNSAENYNSSDPTSLHIEYNQPHNEFDHHIAENKVDSKHPLEDTINGLSHEEIHKILGNYTQNIKDKDLSKLVVNELIHDREIIGDRNVKPLSNITFTPENDTLTAMAFIAGNLLNKLWDMEKDASEGSYETEELKHQKTNDLLGLFKEPLSIRQELFLKNALEKLSHVIDKNMDVKNVSLCTTFEETAINKMDKSNCTDKQTNNQGTELSKSKNNKNRADNLEKQKKATTDAINKINDVLSLIKKYENVRKSLSDLKNSQSTFDNRKVLNNSGEKFSVDENVSLNLFGDLLGKITKLLSPNKSKRVTKKLDNFNLLRKDDIAKKNIENLFNIDLGNMSMNTKDRMIMDYLSNVERHPNCFFSHLQKPVVTPLSNVEGSILYNLSEFFKIKSFADLLHLINGKPDSAKVENTSHITTVENNYNNPTTIKSTPISNIRTAIKTQPSKQESMREKLKNDLKTILQDLVELQTEHGIKPNNKINIADALPCIYKILNADNDAARDGSKNKQIINPINKIKIFIESLKAEMKFMSTNRRSNANMTPRPKSAVVWERAIKNLDKQHKPPIRRYLPQNKKSYTELKELMDNVELSSNSYKNFAIQSGVPPSEKLILLKTLQADLQQYTDVLENIHKSIDTLINLPLEKQNEFKEFVDNADMNLNLNKKVLEEVIKPTNNKFTAENQKARTRILEPNKPLMMPKWADSNDNNNFKLQRDQIINQLIINRLKLYIKNKEASEPDLNSDINYNIAKRIIFYIESGNIPLAKELFKIFAATKQKDTELPNRFTEYGVPVNKRMSTEKSKRPKLVSFKEPIIKVKDPKEIKMLTQDYFMKQLWNPKS